MVDRPRKAVLVQLYAKQGLSSTEVGKSLGAHPGSVRKWLKQYGIMTRKPKDYRVAKRTPYPLKSRLIQMYIEEKRDLAEMAAYFKISITEICRLLELFNISRPEVADVVLPALAEGVVPNKWNTDPEFAPYWRKVVERKELPYARDIDGTLKYVSMDTLSCGHTRPTHRNGQKRNPYRDPAFTQYAQPEHRVCTRCKQEAEFGDE